MELRKAVQGRRKDDCTTTYPTSGVGVGQPKPNQKKKSKSTNIYTSTHDRSIKTKEISLTSRKGLRGGMRVGEMSLNWGRYGLRESPRSRSSGPQCLPCLLGQRICSEPACGCLLNKKQTKRLSALMRCRVCAVVVHVFMKILLFLCRQTTNK